MKKMKSSVKAVLVPALVLTSTAAITYAVPEITKEKSVEATEDSLKLEVERVDSDTVKVSLNNVQDIPKSLQFSVKLEGVIPKDGQNSIKDLIKKAIESSKADEAGSTLITGVLTDFTYNESENTIDVLVTSNQSLPKIGNKIEVFELDVKKTDDNTKDVYKVLPHQSGDYKYVSATNKEYYELGVTHDNQDIVMEVAPRISSTERYLTVVEGKTLTKEEIVSKLGVQLTHEDGEEGLELEMTHNNNVIQEFKEETPGLYELQLKAVKGSKQSEAITVQVSVQLDNVTQKPTITRDGEALTDITLDGGTTFVPLENVKAEDAKGRLVDVTVSVDKALDLDPDQDTDYVLTYTATDIYGNKVEQSITLTVVANQAPVISGVSDHTIKVGDLFDPKAGVKVTDDKDKEIELIVEGEVNNQIPGTYKISYSATDSGGKTTRAQSTVIVNQKAISLNSMPVITANDVTLTVGDEFKALDGVTAEDKEDGNLSDKVKVIENNVDTTIPGEYSVTYQVSDSQGATVTKKIKVTVLMKLVSINHPPQINASDKVIKLGSTFNPLENVTVYDEEDLDLTHKLEVIENNVDTTIPGEYSVTYRVSDSQGATVTKKIKVTVLMKLVSINHPPQINASDKVIKLGSTFNPLENVTVYDEEDLDLTHKLEVIENNVNPLVAGEYKVKYRVTDSGGATTVKEVNVIVKSDLVLATSIVINDKHNNQLYLDGVKTITATINDEADLKEIEWEISNPNIVELQIVENEARIIAKAEGQVVITAKTIDGSQLSDTMTISVSNFKDNKDIPTYVKDMMDPTVFTPISGTGNQATPLEVEIKNGGADKLDSFITTVRALNYEMLLIGEDDEFMIYSLKVSPKSSFFRLKRSTEEMYLTIKVNKTLQDADDINQKLTELIDDKTQKPNTKPTITISGLSTNLTVGDKFEPLTGVTAFDAEDGDLTSSITVIGDVDTQKAGSYQITYLVKDSQGETTSMTITIIVSEKINTGDNEDLDNSVTNPNPDQKPNDNPPQVNDEKPVITITSSIDKITVGESFDPLAGVQAYDKEDGNLTSQIKVFGTVNTNQPGDYQLTYMVEDSNGNRVTLIKTITVVEKQSIKEENSSKPETGNTGVIGYLGLAAITAGGILLKKRKKK